MPLTKKMQREILEYCMPLTSRLKGVTAEGDGHTGQAYDRGEVDDNEISEFLGESLDVLFGEYDLFDEDDFDEEE